MTLTRQFLRFLCEPHRRVLSQTMEVAWRRHEREAPVPMDSCSPSSMMPMDIVPCKPSAQCSAEAFAPAPCTSVAMEGCEAAEAPATRAPESASPPCATEKHPKPSQKKEFFCHRCSRGFATEFNVKRVRSAHSSVRVASHGWRIDRSADTRPLQHFFCADRKEKEQLQLLAEAAQRRLARGEDPPESTRAASFAEEPEPRPRWFGDPNEPPAKRACS
jgi:hypothetical protein